MPHQKLLKLFPVRDPEIERLVELSDREIDGPDKVGGAGDQLQLVVVAAQGKNVELPGLTAIHQRQAIHVDLARFQIDDADRADILLDPGVGDGGGIDAKKPLGQVAKGAMAGCLDLQDTLDLKGGENTLFDQKLTNLNAGQWSLPHE